MRRLIVASLLVLFAGCGASSQHEVAKVIRSSDAAWARGDVAAACSHMTDRARRAYVVAGVEICDEAHAFDTVKSKGNVVVQHLYVHDHEPPHMTGIRVDGDTAVASYSNGDPTTLRRLNGRWLIDSF